MAEKFLQPKTNSFWND